MRTKFDMLRLSISRPSVDYSTAYIQKEIYSPIIKGVPIFEWLRWNNVIIGDECFIPIFKCFDHYHKITLPCIRRKDK